MKQSGAMLMGLGLVFFGMSLMSDAMSPLRTFSPFINLMTHMEIPVLGILTGAVFTSLIQSSAATTGVVIAIASQGLIPLTGGIAIIFGANIGTCVTALLASLGKPRNALKASLIHILFNVFGVVLWVGFIDKLAGLVTFVSPVAEGLLGADKLAAETPRQIANAHSIFNIANTIIFLPFGALFARLADFIVPEKEERIDTATGLALEFKNEFIDDELLAVPSIALEQTRNEMIRMAELVRSLVEDILPGFLANGPRTAELMLAREEEVKFLGKSLERFLIEISRRNLNQQQSELAAQYLDINSDLKRIGKIVRKDFVQLLRRVKAADMEFSSEERELLSKYNGIVLRNLSKAIEAFSEDSAQLAREIVRAKPQVVRQLRDYRELRFKLAREGDVRAAVSRDAHLDLADFLRRIYTFSEAIAFTLLEGYLDGRIEVRPEAKELAEAQA